MVERELKHDVRKTEGEQQQETRRVVVKIDHDRGDPQADNGCPARARHAMPWDDRRLREPIEVVIRIGKREKTRQTDAPRGGEDGFGIQCISVRGEGRLIEFGESQLIVGHGPRSWRSAPGCWYSKTNEGAQNEQSKE